MSLADEERCASCGSGYSGKPGQFLGKTCEDPHHASVWDDEPADLGRRVVYGGLPACCLRDGGHGAHQS